jgi:CheY-like chemotaxis protein
MSKPAAKDPKQPRLHGQRILVVEDNANAANLARQTLLSGGAAEVVTEADGQAALRRLSTFQPDVLVTDLIMPGMGGLELTRAVRQSALDPNGDVPNPSIPIVLVSAFASRGSVRTARSAGIDAFVIKPFSIGSLIKRVDRASRRTADFIVHPAYVGPDRRTRPGAGGQRLTDIPVAANDGAPEPFLRLAASTDPEADDGANSLLMELYAHIRALEAERSTEQD